MQSRSWVSLLLRAKLKVDFSASSAVHIPLPELVSSFGSLLRNAGKLLAFDEWIHAWTIFFLHLFQSCVFPFARLRGCRTNWRDKFIGAIYRSGICRFENVPNGGKERQITTAMMTTMMMNNTHTYPRASLLAWTRSHRNEADSVWGERKSENNTLYIRHGAADGAGEKIKDAPKWDSQKYDRNVGAETLNYKINGNSSDVISCTRASVCACLRICRSDLFCYQFDPWNERAVPTACGITCRMCFIDESKNKWRPEGEEGSHNSLGLNLILPQRKTRTGKVQDAIETFWLRKEWDMEAKGADKISLELLSNASLIEKFCRRSDWITQQRKYASSSEHVRREKVKAKRV